MSNSTNNNDAARDAGQIIIAYNNTDSFGSDGVWIEGKSSEEIEAEEQACITGCGFENTDSLDLTEVRVDRLADLDESEFDDLVSQWGLSIGNGWTSDAVDAAIRAEYQRREEPSISGHAANRALAK